MKFSLITSQLQEIWLLNASVFIDYQAASGAAALNEPAVFNQNLSFIATSRKNNCGRVFLNFLLFVN